MKPGGKLIISLDLELFWGVVGLGRVSYYEESMHGARRVVPMLLAMFSEYGVHATWATVGILFCRDRREVSKLVPAILPRYADPKLSAFSHLAAIGEDEKADPIHYGRELVEAIKATAGQEVGTHTFSHFYCLEAEQSEAAFAADISAAVSAATLCGTTLKSIVFPRNEVNLAYLSSCRTAGLAAYRGNLPHPIFQVGQKPRRPSLQRALRLLDGYLPISGHNCFSCPTTDRPEMHNIPGSRYLRPYNSRLALLERLKIRRVTHSMTYAAANGLNYHLWWHPHDFGRNTDRNLGQLRQILGHYRRLRGRFGMRSVNMGELADELDLRATG